MKNSSGDGTTTKVRKRRKTRQEAGRAAENGGKRWKRRTGSRDSGAADKLKDGRSGKARPPRTVAALAGRRRGERCPEIPGRPQRQRISGLHRPMMPRTSGGGTPGTAPKRRNGPAGFPVPRRKGGKPPGKTPPAQRRRKQRVRETRLFGNVAADYSYNRYFARRARYASRSDCQRRRISASEAPASIIRRT